MSAAGEKLGRAHPHTPGIRARIRILAAAIGSCAIPALAADGNWLATPQDTNWSNPQNWQGGIIADGEGYVANFRSDSAQVVSVDAGRVIGALNFAPATAMTAANWTLEGQALTISGPSPLLHVEPQILIARASLIAPSGLTKDGDGQVILLGDLSAGAAGLRIDDGTFTFASVPASPQLVSLPVADAGAVELRFNTNGALPSAGACLHIDAAGGGHVISGFGECSSTLTTKTNNIASRISLAGGTTNTLRAARWGAPGTYGYVRFGDVRLAAGSQVNVDLAAGANISAIHDIHLLGDATYNNSVDNARIFLGDVTADTDQTLTITGSKTTQLIGRLGGRANLLIDASVNIPSGSPAGTFGFATGGRSVRVISGTTTMDVDPAANLSGIERGRFALDSDAGSLVLRFNANAASADPGSRLDIDVSRGRVLTAVVNNSASRLLATYAPKITVNDDGTGAVDASLRSTAGSGAGLAGAVRFSDVNLSAGARLQLVPENSTLMLVDLTAAPEGSTVETYGGSVFIGHVGGGKLIIDNPPSAAKPIALVGRLEGDVMVRNRATVSLAAIQIGFVEPEFLSLRPARSSAN